MSKSKSILFTSLFCLSLFTTELLALDSNESKPEKQKNSLSLGGIFKSLEGTVKGLGKSLDGTVKGLGKSLDGTVNGLGKAIGGTVDGVGEALGGTMEGIGEFVEENGEAVLFIGVVFAAMLGEAEFYHHGYGHHYGHNDCYYRW